MIGVWRRFVLSPRWLLFHLIVLAGSVGMIAAGLWQLDRLDHRRAFNETVEARTARAPVPLAETLGSGGDQEWTPVVVSGSWLNEHQVLVVNRSQGGVAGRNIVTPVLTSEGRVVAVTRGFLALSAPLPELDQGEVVLRGLLRSSETRGFGGVSDPEQGRLEELQRLDLDRLARQLPPELAAALVPWSVALEASDPAQPASVVPVARPELSEGPHLSYAIQWFFFTLCVLIGWGFAMSRSLRTARRRALPTPDRPSSDLVGSATRAD